MGEAVFVRDATEADLAVLSELFGRSALVSEDGREALLAHPEHLEFALPRNGDWRCRVAVGAGGAVVGFATVLFPGGAAELEDLFVDPPAMGRGIGRILVCDVAEIVGRRGIGRLDVTANPTALSFYEKTGFVGGGEVATPLGRGVRMQRRVG